MCVCVYGCSHTGLCLRTCSLTNPECNAASLASPYFSTLSHKRYDFRKKVTKHKMCFSFSLQQVSETFLIPRRIQQDIVINANGQTDMTKRTVAFRKLANGPKNVKSFGDGLAKEISLKTGHGALSLNFNNYVHS